jgi:protein tyrosine/serine phosphatase
MRTKTFFLLFFVFLGWLLPTSLMAQLTAGTYYLYNVGAERYLNYGGSDNYTACLKPHGEPVVLNASGDGFTVQTALDSRYLSSTATSENARQKSGTVFIFTEQADGTYTISSSEGFMGYGGTIVSNLAGTEVQMNLSDGTSSNAHWQILSRGDLEARFSEASPSNPVDATFLVTCPNFDRHHANLSAWSNLTTGNNSGYLCNNAGYKFDANTTVQQTLTNVPNGIYLLKAQAFYRHGSNGIATGYTEATMPLHGVMFAGENQVLVKSILSAENRASTDIYGSYGRSFGGGYIPYGAKENFAGACIAFDHGLFSGNEVQTIVADGSLTIGFKIDELTQYSWIAYDNIELYYLGPVQDLTPLKEQYYALRTKIQDIIIDQTSAYTDEGGVATSAYNTVLATQNDIVENATTEQEITDAKTALWAAALTFMKSVDIIGTGFDLTWLIQDAEFNDADYTKYWKETMTVAGTKGVVGGDNKVLRYFNCNFDLSQTLPYTLPAGAYRMKVDGFERTNSPMNTAYTDYDAGNSVVTGVIYLNNNAQTVKNLFDVQSVTDNHLGGVKPTGASFYIADGSNSASQYLSAGLYSNELFAVMPEDGEVTIGYRCSNTVAWTVIDNFHLYYRGEHDLSGWQGQLELAVTEAQTLDIPTAPKQILTDVIEQYNKTYTTAEEYQNAIERINAAKAVAEPYVEPYAWFKTMRAKIQENLISQTAVYTDENNAADNYNSALMTANSNVENVSSVDALETVSANLWAAALTFMKAVTINQGKGFDLTWLIQDAEFNDADYTKYWKETLTSSTTKGVVGGDNKVMRYYNCNFDLGQTLPYAMPAGAYRMKVDGFERTNDPMDAAYADYAAGSSVVTGVIYLNNNEQTVMNLFDVQSVTTDALEGVQPTDASFYIANGSTSASRYLSAGYYPNELIAVMPEDGEATIGYRCANMVAWTVIDNFRLEYIGEVPTEEITVTPGELTPVLAPFTIDASDERVTELYAIGSVDENNVAQLYPVSSVAPGVPCVVKLNTATLSGSIEATTCRSYLLPWEGGTLAPDKENNTWKYVNEKNVEQTTTFNVLEWSDMSFDVNIENLAARKFLANVAYSSALDASLVSRYNVAPPTRRDIPNAVMIPVPPFTSSQVTVTLSSDKEAIATTQVAQGESEAYFYNLLPNSEFEYAITDGESVISQGHITTKGNLRMVYAPSAYNIRDFGGWLTQDGHRTNYGHLFRGSTLNGYANTTAEDLQTLRDLGVGGEIDLRWKEDYDKDLGCGTSAFGFTLGEDYYFAAANDFTAANLSESATQQRIKEEFDFILNHFRQGKGVYFHCAWGADRTGMLAFLLEGVLGLTIDQIYKDYELTSFSAAPGATNRLKTSFQDRIDVILALEGETLRDKFENYFLNSLGVSAEDINYFRNVMINEPCTTVELLDDDRAMVEGEKNADIIGAAEGKTVNVTLAGRTLYKDKGWNTICLPFALSKKQLTDEDCPLYGATIVTLSTATFSSGSLTLDFVTAEAMEAGKSYLVKWTDDGLEDIANPVFNGVTISSTEPTDVIGEDANFHGIYSPYVTGGEDKTMLYLGADNYLYYPEADMTIKSFRAYFTLNNGLICGESIGDNNTVNSFVLNFGEETTSIEHLPFTIDHEAGAYYDLSGRKLSGKPTQKGVYIINGNKVVMK